MSDRFETDCCLHCGIRLAGPFCHGCGQGKAERLTLRGFFRRAWESVLDLDGRLPRTLVGLVTDPGGLARRYVEGDRVRTATPLVTLLLAATAYAFVISAFDVPLISPLGQRAPEQARGAANLMLSAIGYLMIAGLVPLGALQARLLRRHGKTAAECYVMLLYSFALQLVIAAILGAGGALDDALGWRLLRVAQAAVLAWTLGGFYRRPAWRFVPVALLLAVVQYALMITLGVALMAAAFLAGIVDLPRPGGR
jgi:hypothetical protein